MPINCLDGVYPFFEGDVSVALTLAKVRRIFEAQSCLDKACELVDLTVIQLERLFGGSKRKHCKNLVRIGKRLGLQAHDGTHEHCTRCEVVTALRGEPFNKCVVVAKFKEPKDQLREAMALCLFG